MPDIKTLLQDMINIGEDPEKIQAVADQYKETNPGWSVTATKEDDPEVEEIKEEEVEKIEEDDSLVYDYRTEGVKGTPGYKAAWGKSTDAGKTFEVVDVNEIPQEWYEDPKFKEVEQLEGLKVYKDDKEITWEQVKKDTKLYNSLSREEKRNLARNSKEQTTKDPLTASAAAMGSFYESDLPSTVKKGMTIVNVLKALPTIATDSEERVRLGKFMKNRIDNIPEALQTALISTQAAYMDTYRSNYLEEDGVMSGLVPEEKLKEAEEKAGELIIKKYNELSELEFKDTGKGIVAGAKDGDAASLIAGVFGAGISMVETMIPAMATGGLSLPFQIAAPMYTDYNKAKAKALYGEEKAQLTLEEEENAIRKLVENNETEIAIPMALGVVATGLEYIGFKGVDDFIRATPGKGKILAELMWTGNREGWTEVGQLGVERLNQGLGGGKSILEASGDAWDAMASDEGLEMWLNGFLGSTQMSVGGRAINRALRNDNTGVKELNKKINNLADLNNKKYSTKNKDVKEALDVEIKEAEQDLKNYITQKRKISEILNEDQKQSLINIINKKDNIKSKVESLRKQVDSGAISTKEFGYAVRSLSNQDKKLTEQIELINATAKEQLLQTGLEATKEEAGKLGVEQQEFENKEDYAALFGVPGSKEYKEALEADGHISNDGKTFYVNREIAAQEGAIGVGSHELLHAIIGKSYSKLTTEAKKKLNTEFLGLLGKKEKAAILTRLAGSYGITGDKVFETEELFTAFSDEIVDGGLSFNEGVFGKIKNTVHKVLNSLGVKKEFKSARQTYNFLKDYSKNIKKGKLTERAAEFAKEDPGVEGKRMSKTRGKLVDDISDLQQGATTKADFQKPGTFNKVFESVQPGGAINNYIKSLGMSKEKTQETIDAVTDRLINFDPAAKRKDGTVIGPKGLGEFIMANVGFGKLVAAKKLAVEGEKTKKETSIDTEEAKQIANTTSTTEVEDKSKARNLKDFDIEVEDGLVDAEIAAEIESLLEKNPADIEVQMERLILGDIRKMLDGIVGKISMNKKTGKREPSPEYNSFVRNEYTEIIQSLGMETIRDAYRPWFEKKKVRTEKYKGISPTTGKPTNYVKDVFENTTNKREYIRWFLEGKPGVLTERRTALLRRIARRKAKIATDNYIEANSKDLGKVAEAKLRKASRAIEDTQNEQKSFDSIRFSKTMDVTSLNQEFGFIQRMTKKVGTKWIGYINPYTNLPQTFVDLGRMYEQAFANHFIKMKIKGLEVISKIASEEGGMADFVMSFNNKIENHEIKASITAFMGSISISSFNLKKGVIKLATDVHNNLLGDIDMVEFTKGYKKRIDFVNKGIEKLNETRPKNKQYDLLSPDVVSGKPQYIPYELYMDKKGFGTKMFYQLKSDERVIQSHYNGKDVHSLSFVGTKFANMSVRLSGKSILNLPMLSADTDINFTFRNSGSKMINGNKMIALSLGVQFKISKLKNNPRTTPDITIKEHAEKALGINFSKSIEGKKLNNAVNQSRSANNESKGITVLDFDDTLATTKSLVKFTRPDGTTGTLNAEEYASTYEDLLGQGYTFDFSDFNKVVKGKIAPLFQKAIKLQSKFGSENMFVLTARPPQAAKAIFDFLKANGLNIPMKNITGLANSTAESKALWMADKVADGYNDFYFADDAMQNVQAVKNMLDQFDVKSKVQQAKVKFSKSMNNDFNDILENVTDIESEKRFSAIKARKRGDSKGKFRFFIPPSHEDFVGLLYNFIGKGKEGNAHRDFFEKALVRPLNRAYRELNAAKQSIANDLKSLNKEFKDVRKKLAKKTPDGDFTYQDAVRIYLWNKHGHTIPGLSKTDQAALADLVMSDPSLQAYAETVNVISKQDAYVNPSEGWESGDIRTDLDDATGRVGREQFFTEFNENSEIIFSEENLNKIEAAYGADVVSAIKDILYRTKTGRNRPSGQNELTNRFMNYLNGSVAATMFFNIRSSVLQQMSMVNFINFGDNNILSAAKAFANQPQYYKDWAKIFNSDFMKQRRGGIKTDINGAELAASLRGAKNTPRALLAKLLELGFLPTQIGDNVAIATGGATFYRNRINTYKKQGLSQKEAEAKAWTDFEALAEATQQSARPDMVSQQQASPLGKIILAFQNVTSQFNRLGKKAFLDIKNRRISPEYKNASNPQLQSDLSNVSRIGYYFAIQNLIFYSLQTALFSAMFDDDEDDERMLKKKERIINGTLDSVLRGSGVWGAVISTVKNMAIAYHQQRAKDWNGDEASVLVEMLNVSPPLGIKARKIVNAERTLNYNKSVVDEMGTFDIDNPMWSAYTSYTEAITNVPLNRLYNKTQNVRQSLDNQHTATQRALMFSGWSQWNLGIGDSEKIEEVKEVIKEKKKVITKQKQVIKKEKKIEEKKKEGEDKQAKEKKEGKEVTCLICKLPIVSGKKYCTVHEKVKQRKDGAKVQCKKMKQITKKKTKQCGVMTSNKSGLCYYHD